MKTLKNFLFSLFSASDDVSMKRFTGFLIILVLLSLSYLGAFEKITNTTWGIIEDWLRTLLYMAALFLGLGAILDGVKLFKGPKQ